jgi:DNA polymerase-3 subunit alpha
VARVQTTVHCRNKPVSPCAGSAGVLAKRYRELRTVTGMRGRSVLFKLDDKSDAIEAVASEELLQANRDVLKDDELVVVQGKVQPDRFAGGLRLMVQQVWDLAAARCRFGKYLEVEVNGHVPPVSEVLREFRSRRLANRAWRAAAGPDRAPARQARAPAPNSTSARPRASTPATPRSHAGASAASEGVARVVYE